MSAPPPGSVVREPEGSLGRRVALAGVLAVVPIIVAIGFLGLWATVVLAIVAVVLLGLVAKDSLLASVRWNRPSVQVEAVPYALGSIAPIIYRRQPKRVRDISSCTVECLLVCEERVTYRQGTDTRTDSRRVYENTSTAVGQGTADGLVAEIDLNISAHMGAPSFTMPNNEVVWFVEIRVAGTGLPRDSHRFVIDVAPVLDLSYRAGVQDT